MINYNKVTVIEYFEKKKEILDNLGRTDGACTGVDCAECPLYSVNTEYTCDGYEIIEPLEAVKNVMGYEIPVDWSKVSIDTKVLVRDNKDDEWEKKHFAKYEYGRVYCWHDGKTSYSCNTNSSWNFSKLYEGEE